MGNHQLEPISPFAYRHEMWMDEAKCSRYNPSYWESSSLPAHSTRDPGRRERAARERCRGCPVIRQCAEYAVRTESTDHIFAGVELRQRGANQKTYVKLNQIANGGSHE